MLADKLSIVLITWNRREAILRTLRRLTATGGEAPVIVVDNASSDGTADAITAHFPGVRVLRSAKNQGAAGYNDGVRAATTPYVAFCDDDTWWAPAALARGVALLDAHPRVAVLTARVLVGADRRDDPVNAAMAASPLPPIPGLGGLTSVAGLLAGACLMRRDAFLAAGGYEPRFFLGSEERLLAIDLMAAGWYLAWSPELLVHHYPSRPRDSRACRRLQLRNALWCAWLRRPFASAWRESAALLAANRGRQERWPALVAALRGLPWVLARRQPVHASVDAVLQVVERASVPRAGETPNDTAL